MLRTGRTLLIGALAVAIAGGIVATGQPQPAHADALPQILPSPQQETAGGVSFPLTGSVTVVVGANTDPSAEQLLTKTISVAGGTANLVTSAPYGDAVYLGTTGDNPAMAGVLASINLDGTTGIKPEGYVLGSGTVNGHNVLALDGIDASGTYYAVQTLRQIVKDGAVPAVTVRDWPLMSIRGEIEGFYGIPWSHQARMDMMAFDGTHKMNTYIYTPKDDAYLRAKWRTPYPQAELDKLKALVAQANAHHVNFTFALSPGSDVCYSSDADFAATTAKFDQLRAIGVTSFYIALDDIPLQLNCAADKAKFTKGNWGWLADAQTYYLNRLVKEYIEPNHLQPLQTVPTNYSGSGVDPYKTEFGTTLDPSVRVQWTGEGVFSDQITLASVTNAAQNYYTKHLYIWDNFPVNDGQLGRLFLNPLTGRDPQLYTKIDGITSNPMIEPYASMVALAGYGDYTWNSPKYDASVTQAAIIDELAGADPAMQNSLGAFVDLNQSWTPYRASSQHAPELAADIDAFWAAYQAGDAAGMKPLEDRLATIAAAPETLKSMAQPGFYSDAQPWIVAAAHWATAMQEEVASLTAIQSGQGETATKSILAALGEVTAANQATVPDLGNNGQVVPNAIVPSVGDGVFQTFSDKAVAAYNTWLGATPVGGLAPYAGTASTSMGTYAGNSPSNMTDGNLSTFYWSNQTPAVGDYVQVDLGAVKSVGSVAIHQADSDTTAGDMLYHADLQYSTNGKDWTTAAHFDNAPLVSYSFDSPVQARYARLVATDVNPGSKWVKIREFQVSPTYGVTTTAGANLGQYQNYAPSNMADGGLSTFYWSNQTPAVGDYVQADLGAVKSVGSVAIHQADSDTTAGDMLYHADLQYSTNGKDWTTAAHFDNAPLVSYSFPSPVTARYLRLTATDVNPGSKWVKIREFQVSPGSVLVTTDVPAAGASSPLNAFDASIQTAFTAAGIPNEGATLTRAFTASTHLGSITLVGAAAGALQYKDADGWHDLGALDSGKMFQEVKVDKAGVDAVRIVFSGVGGVVPTIYELVTRDGGPIAKDPLIGSDQLATVNVELQAHDGGVLSGGSASVYVNGKWTPITAVNPNNHGLVQTNLSPGTYSFAEVYNGTRVQQKVTISSASVQSVYFHTALVNVWTENHKSTPISGGSASYYAAGKYHPITTKNVNNPKIVQAEMLPGTYTFQDVYNGTHQKKKFTVLEPNPNNGAHSVQSVYFHTALVNVELQDSTGAALNIPGTGSASYYAGSWHPITGVNPNNGAMVQAEMLPGTYSFAATYNGTRQQKKFTVLEPNPNNGAHASQSVYFHTALVNVWTENHTSTPISGGSAAYYADGKWRPVTTKNVNNPKIVQAEMLPGTYSFQDVYNGTRQQKKYTVLEPNPNNGAHASQSVYFHFTV